MSFDTTGLTEVKMRKYRGQQGSYYVDGDVCVARTCSRCRVIKAAEEFPAHNAMKYGLSVYCYECKVVLYGSRREYEKSYNALPTTRVRRMEHSRKAYLAYKNRTPEEIYADQLRLRPDGIKKCRTCKATLPVEQFSSSIAKPDGLNEACRRCRSTEKRHKYSRAYVDYWTQNQIPLECYLCGSGYEEIEHLIPLSHPLGLDVLENTRPACAKCNRGFGGKFDEPLEEYIWSADHPTKTRAQILYEIVMSGTWPFALTTPEEFVEQFKNLEEAECTSR